MPVPRSRTGRLAVLPVFLLLAAGCVYFNTYYNAQTYYKEGLRFKEQNSAVQAKAKFEKSIEKSALVISGWPRSRWVDDATFLIGMSYYQMGSYDNAVRHFEQLVLAFPGSGLVPRAELYRGLALLKDKQYGVARVVLDEVGRKYPKLGDAAAFHLAEALYERKEYARAVDSLAGFVGRFSGSRYVLAAVRYLAEACYALARWQEAEEWYGRYVRLLRNPQQRAAAKLKVAGCRLAQGKHEQAADQVRDVLGRYENLDDEAYLLLGRSLAELGREPEALEAWSEVRGMSDLGAEAYFRIGKHYEEKKEFATARAYYDTARSRRANSDYGVLAVKRLALLDAFTEQDSTGREPAEALFLLAEVHNLNLAEYEEAKRLYQAVYDSFPESDWAPKGLFAKAWLMKKIENDSAAAAEVLGRIIRGYPETEYADESRRWLGLPVPKRKPREEPKPETLVVAPETLAVVVDSTRIPERVEEMKPEPEELAGPVGKEELKRPVKEREPAAVKRIEERTEEPDTGAAETAPDTTREVQKRPRELEIVHFDYDRWEVRPADAEILRQDAALLLERPEVTLEIVGHCDPRGTDEYNQALGMKRAEATRDALVKAGVPADRLAVRSEGEQRPISTNPDEYWLDRRVEFVTR